MKKYLLPKDGQFYKANLHCHTTISDGRLTPEQVKEQYMAHGYSVVAYTDHNLMVPHPELQSDDFVALTGYEIDVEEQQPEKLPSVKTCHFCLVALDPDTTKQVCWSRKEMPKNEVAEKLYEELYKEEEDYERVYNPAWISEMMRIGRESGFFITYNHPVWSLEDMHDYLHYHNMDAMEICNYGSMVLGYPEYSPHIYDEMLRYGKRIYCIAADDNHNHAPADSPKYDSFGGFTMIKADNLKYETIAKALKDGNFYASQGPEIKELWYEDGVVHVKTGPAKRIEFMTGKRSAYSEYAAAGETVDYACFKVPADAIYVRVTVVDECGKCANTNAYFLDEMNL